MPEPTSDSISSEFLPNCQELIEALDATDRLNRARAHTLRQEFMVEISRRDEHIAELHSQILSMRQSLSWRVTMPLRLVRRYLARRGAFTKRR